MRTASDGMFWARPRSKPEAVAGMPFMASMLVEASTHPVHYAMTTVDVHGRLWATSLLTLLAWNPGQRISIAVTEDIIVISRTTDGRRSVTRDRQLRLPAAIMHRFRLAPGDRVLMAAPPGRDCVLVYPTAVLSRILQRHNPELWGCSP